MENIDVSLVDWSRAQFALTAMYHWIFVPLTLGLSFLVAIMETFYVKTGDEFWKKTTKFWMTLFGINFAIGVATGIILEFEFGTNWSNYSWFVGDIFGAPLAIEGIMAFFMESTFIAIMFFGWNKVGKKTHLVSSWLTAIGANLSALWILVANAWMQYPAGMTFNPDTARNEMANFWDVLFSPVAMNKFLHTISSGYVTAAAFVIGISCWYLLKKRDIVFAKKSIVVAAVFGLITSVFIALTGDGSAKQVADKQPMKLAAMEGLYDGKANAGLVAFGILDHSKQVGDNKDPFLFKVEIPSALSILSFGNSSAYVPGINDIIKGGYMHTNTEGNSVIAQSTEEKIASGKAAITAFGNYRKAVKAGDTTQAAVEKKILSDNFKNFGYGYLNNPKEIVPHVPLTFYTFHIMVALGFFFILFFLLALIFALKDTITKQKWFLWVGPWSILLAFIASQSGWIVAEVGRQPWVIQDIMPTVAAVSRIDASSVMITFSLFAAIFTLLLVAEIRIMLKQIKKGPEGGH
ncbi:cytochrome ubiquinol oxidase subunit I [Alistipes sp. ZOR0009]|uniref:cytochrome ubiquinol oxidase subunit I n=1 Tax=Alistipes sp. ZOR0009 TaxID=1339253 RepID=UPI0006469D00|nr:cytochrome ubiquinol oxidase subunit I [Alistipes sp. ZOR0009]